ncbi:hypothetical protein Pst134EA_017309 [Puccinia striiformis f. sp. tritici]|uniref:hypothetical protein n=1 Tax=Puccinia striiformis f. sp. tritici TaxID=168172 RepID=UPI002008754C|nr:hypothetical protein Pst134EA_017309 [Puccinia striiformis f. sp. tritici]KAH9461001.1 hypothetical protein Pst134EA_017309 [Puccinia striiformis f. sp. tritici]
MNLSRQSHSQLSLNRSSQHYTSHLFDNKPDSRRDPNHASHQPATQLISPGKLSGDISETGGTTLGVSFLKMLIKAGDPLRKFHTYAAGMSVIEELLNIAPVAD